MNRNKGFTLVEILIVVIILGILAAIVIPQFTQAADDARLSTLRSDTQTVRSQLELYRVQEGSYPPANDVVNELVDGGYLQKFPSNPFATADMPLVTNDAGTPAHWLYDPANRIFRPNDGGETQGVEHNDI